MTASHRPGLTLLLGLLVALAPLSTDLYLPSMPSMTRALGASAREVQFTLSGYMLAWAVAQLFAGPLSDRFGRRPSLLAALAMFTLASVACALAPGIDALIAARVVQGVAGATAVVVPRAAVRDLHAGDRAAQMLATMMIVLAMAPVVAPSIGGLLQHAFGWRSNFAFLAVYGAVALVLVWRFLPETRETADRGALNPRRMVGNWARILRSPHFRGYLAVAALNQAGLFAFLAGSSFVLIEVMGTGEQLFGLLFGAVMIGNVSGATTASRLVRRLGLDRMIRIGTAVALSAAVAMASMAWLDVRHPLAIVAPMFAYMFVFMWTMPQATAGALTPFPDVAGSATSLLSFVQMVFAAAAALVVGIAFDGTPRPMATAIVLASAGAFLAFRMLVPGQARAPA
jgi:DHA1 family bicyclomycin/chloramphenicol resistance-like MFS transporter